MSSLLAGKIAVVTGASSGIGRAIAIGFAGEGASVVIADITEEPLEGGDSTLEIITRAGGAASFRKTDVGRWDEVQLAVVRVTSTDPSATESPESPVDVATPTG